MEEAPSQVQLRFQGEAESPIYNTDALKEKQSQFYPQRESVCRQRKGTCSLKYTYSQELMEVLPVANTEKSLKTAERGHMPGAPNSTIPRKSIPKEHAPAEQP